MTSKSPTGGGQSPAPKNPPGAEVDKGDAAEERARRAEAEAEELRGGPKADPRPAGTVGVVPSEPLPGREPPGPPVESGWKSPGPEVVPPAQTNAAEAELSRGETRPAGRAAPEPDAADEPKGGGMPGDVHPAVTDYEAREAESKKEPKT